jgi:hypothetical protein
MLQFVSTGFALLHLAHAVFAVSSTQALGAFRCNNDPAPVRGYLESFLALKEQAMGRYHLRGQFALQYVATKWMHLVQVLCIDEYPAFSVIVFPNHVNQHPGRAAVQVSPWAKVNISIAFPQLNAEFALHIDISPSGLVFSNTCHFLPGRGLGRDRSPRIQVLGL